jgi:hypothetical protein
VSVATHMVASMATAPREAATRCDMDFSSLPPRVET